MAAGSEEMPAPPGGPTVAEMSSQRSRRGALIWLLAAAVVLTAVAAGLRLHDLGVAGLWNDELYTVRSSLAIGETRLDKRLGYVPTWLMLVATGNTDLPPNDSVGWQAAGLSPEMIRLPTAIVGIATIPVAMLVGLFAFGPRFAVALGFMFAVCPWHIYWSQGARFYTVQVLLMTVSLLAYWSGVRRRSWRWQVLAAAAFGMSVLSQPNAVILAAVPVIDLAWTSLRRRRLLPMRSWRLGVGGMAAWAAAGVITASLIVLGMVQAWDTYSQFVAGDSPKGVSGAAKLVAGVAYMLTPVVAVLVAGAAIDLFRRAPRSAVFLAACAAVPVVGYAAWAIGNNVGLRYLFVAITGLMALGAVALVRLTSAAARRHATLAWLPAAAVLASVAPLLVSYYTSGYGLHPRWPDAYAAVQRLRLPGEPVVARHPIVASYYLQEPVGNLPAEDEIPADAGRSLIAAMETDTRITWANYRVELLEAFDIRVFQPSAEVHVRRIHPTIGSAPQTKPATGAGGAAEPAG